jgi:hypothetical protein
VHVAAAQVDDHQNNQNDDGGTAEVVIMDKTMDFPCLDRPFRSSDKDFVTGAVGPL